MPADGIKLIQHSEVLSFEEISEVVDAAIVLGVEKVRITGGEPLVRKGITGLIQILSVKKGITDLSMTTNGQLLEQYASDLKNAGLHRVNISLDTMNATKFREVTRGGDLNRTLRGIEAALIAGLNPVKINCVVQLNREEPDAVQVAAFAEKLGVSVRFIRKMDLVTGEFFVVDGGSGGDCKSCNRLRLTADGHIKPCLFDSNAYNVRHLGAKEALIRALANKPECGTSDPHGKFYQIGC
jgi:cyclic pyranopterin phosphate synthase